MAVLFLSGNLSSLVFVSGEVSPPALLWRFTVTFPLPCLAIDSLSLLNRALISLNTRATFYDFFVLDRQPSNSSPFCPFSRRMG